MASAAVATFLTEPWSEAFMQRALLEVVFLGVVGGCLGVWILANRVGFAAEALPHTMFPGLVIASLLGIPLLVGGAAAVVLALLVLIPISKVRRVDRGTSIAVIYTGMFGLGALLALSPDAPSGVSDLLFGDVLGLTNVDVVGAAVLAVAVVVAIYLLYPRLLALVLDRSTAQQNGIARPTEVVLMLLLAAATLVSTVALGNLFVAATLIAPAAAVANLNLRPMRAMVAASFVGVFSGIIGLYISYFASTAAGATIAATAVGVFAAISIASRFVPMSQPS